MVEARIYVGTQNNIKVHAVRETLLKYQSTVFAGREIVIAGILVDSGVTKQPITLEETLTGAKTRADRAWCNDCTFSVGIEGGLMQIPFGNTLSSEGRMEVCACVIKHDRGYALGISSAFDHPRGTLPLVLEKGLEIDEVYTHLQLTKDPRLGKAGGAIGLLTNGRVNRTEQVQQAITTAMIRLEHPELF